MQNFQDTFETRKRSLFNLHDSTFDKFLLFDHVRVTKLKYVPIQNICAPYSYIFNPFALGPNENPVFFTPTGIAP